MGMLERIGSLLDVAVRAEENSDGPPSAEGAAAIASLAAAGHRALMARALEERLAPAGFGGRGADEGGDLDRAAELLEVEGREFRLGVVTGEGKEQRTVEKVVRASGRDAALALARAVWPGATDVVVVDEGNDGGAE